MSDRFEQNPDLRKAYPNFDNIDFVSANLSDNFGDYSAIDFDTKFTFDTFNQSEIRDKSQSTPQKTDVPSSLISTKKENVEDNDENLQKLFPKVISILNLLNKYIFSQPFIVFRRQAQVNNRSRAYHLTPLTVIPFMIRIQGSQGVSAFFKGLPSILVNHVLLIGSELAFQHLLTYTFDQYSFKSTTTIIIANKKVSDTLIKDLLSKCLALLVVTPFICSGSVETVQSLIVGDSPRTLEHIKEGFLRIFHFKNDRKLPLYMLVGPSILYHISYEIIYSLTLRTLLYIKHNFGQQLSGLLGRQKEMVHPKPPLPNNWLDEQMVEERYSLYAHITTDILLYPFQTILYRLFLQGTRTLIDNVDGKTAVIPLISNYESATDCYQSIIKQEGTMGLFKGFGALVLQYSVQATVLQLAYCCFDMLL